MNHIVNPNYSHNINILYADSPSFSGIVAGECKGDVWVDNVGEPTLALVYSFAVGGFSILGEPEDISVYDEFKNYVTEQLFVELKNKGFGCFEFTVESKKAEEHILKLFSDKSVCEEEEYTFRKAEISNFEAIEKDYRFFKVDKDFVRKIEEGQYENAEFISERILESWGSYDLFLHNSLAYTAVWNNSIAAVIVGTARYKNIIPIDIETIEVHRNKGLAYTLVQYFINECVNKGFIAQWDCVASNVGSKKIAEKAGFKLLNKKSVYWFKI